VLLALEALIIVTASLTFNLKNSKLEMQSLKPLSYKFIIIPRIFLECFLLEKIISL